MRSRGPMPRPLRPSTSCCSDTLSFTSANTYQITDTTTGQTIVANGSYTAGSTIQFQGVAVTVNGAPATGDSFTIAPSGNQSMFATLTQLAAALNQPADTPAAKAQLATAIGNALTNIDQGISHLSTVSASVGASSQTRAKTSPVRSLSTRVRNSPLLRSRKGSSCLCLSTK